MTGRLNNLENSIFEEQKLGIFIEESKEKNKTNSPPTVYTVSNIHGFISSDEFFDKQVYSKNLSTYKIIRNDYFAYNPYRVNVGSIGLFKGTIGLVSSAYVVFKIAKKEKLFSDFLYKLIKSPSFIAEIKRMSMSRGSVRRSLSFKDLSDFAIPLPPLPEQQKIASVLSTIQEAKEKTEIIIRATKELKKSMMKHLFTYGSVPVEDAEKVPLKETEIGMIPEYWSVKKLGEIVIQNKGLQRGPWGGSIKKDIFVPSGYKIYEQGNVIKNNFSLGSYFIDEKKFKELVDFEVKHGDILISAAGTLGKLAIVPDNIKRGIINQALLRIRLDESKILKIFFKYFFNNIVDKGAMEGYSHGATLKNLSSIKVLRNIFIPIPPHDDQKKIAATLLTIDDKIEAEEHKSKALDSLFKTLLSLLMTGKLRVKDLEIPV